MLSDARQIETQTQVHRLTDTKAYNTQTATTQIQHTHTKAGKKCHPFELQYAKNRNLYFFF